MATITITITIIVRIRMKERKKKSKFFNWINVLISNIHTEIREMQNEGFLYIEPKLRAHCN